MYDLFHAGLACVHRHFTETTAKPKSSIILEFNEYLKILHFLRPLDDGSSSEGEEQEVALEGEDPISIV